MRTAQKKRVSTPWGTAQIIEQLAPGITWYSTASHGGYHLSKKRIKEMPEKYQQHKPWAGPGWYEEDCDWAFVALSFPEVFEQSYGKSEYQHIKESALKTLEWLKR